ncbi:MAG: Mut7-C RNAse domain-containing protein [Candidatus Thorarchaeota archaeon]
MTQFIVDAMLGKLALWLRLTGHDTIYSTEIDDDEILGIAEREKRVLLTADAELYKRSQQRGIDALILRGNVDERVARVFREFDIQPHIDPSNSRCSKCNGTLEELDNTAKERIRNLVHEQTYNHYDTFWYCHDCQSVYFQGGQWENINEYMDRIRGLLS